MVLKMFFLIFSNTNIQFAEKKPTQRFYTIAKALSIIKKVELINKKKFVKIALDKNFKTFIMYIATLETLLAKILTYIDRKAEITFLLIKKITIPDKYFFVDVFFKKEGFNITKAK